MSNFVKFRDQLATHFNEMQKDVYYLYVVNVDKDELWNKYLDSFPEGTNEIYRKRREYDCSCCRHFIKSIGNVVKIKDGQVITIWDFNTEDNTYKPVLKALSSYIKEKTVTDIFLCTNKKVGVLKNFERCENGDINEYEHFFLDLPNKFVCNESINEFLGYFREAKRLFKNSLDELTIDSTETVLEIISQNSLYRGAEWAAILEIFLEYQKQYSDIREDLQKDLFAWEKSVEAGGIICRLKNKSIGVLLSDISAGMDLEDAVRKYEKIVAPDNYKRPNAIFTEKMVQDAKREIMELGYYDALSRRFAKMDDLTVNDVLFVDRSVKEKSDDLFAELERDAVVNPKKFTNIEEVEIKEFVNNILPKAQHVEALVENRHSNNMVSLIAPVNKDAKQLTKWDNGYSWAYTGNITDSMKDRVKKAGGKVDGVLRFSIQWNDYDHYNPNDFDAHCIEPDGNEIYYCHPQSKTGGELDVDITLPQKNVAAVENITWENISSMPNGDYKFFVHNYSYRGGTSGFKAEIEFNNELYEFAYDKTLLHREKVPVAIVKLHSDKTFSIKGILPTHSSSVSSKDMWGIKTNNFTPIKTICYSPNYWEGQNKIGNKHYFFMLDGCKNPEKLNGMFNEYLKEDIVRKHKRVFEALGSKTSVQDVGEQLSGVGFSSTKRNSLIVKVSGKTEKMLKIKF
ncbi:MAG: YfaP family protein [Anaerostipes sp.]|uniref:YfaP family protein n=1 Tax=Anaerostipes sp. TaxID=1872530 RepID=UPI003993B8A0